VCHLYLAEECHLYIALTAASQISAIMDQSHRIWQSNGAAAHLAPFLEPPGGAGSIAPSQIGCARPLLAVSAAK
jgi:hypothetical protein